MEKIQKRDGSFAEPWNKEENYSADKTVSTVSSTLSIDSEEGEMSESNVPVKPNPASTDYTEGGKTEKRKPKKKKSDFYSRCTEPEIVEKSCHENFTKDNMEKSNNEAKASGTVWGIDLEFQGKKKPRRRRRNSDIIKDEKDNKKQPGEAAIEPGISKNEKENDIIQHGEPSALDGKNSDRNKVGQIELDFLDLKKKPRKPKSAIIYDISQKEGKDLCETDDNDNNKDSDYPYEKLLEFVYTNIKENNPELRPGETKKLKMPFAQVLREGARRTGFYNFLEICRALHRQPKHVFDFILMEFATSGSIDLKNKLTLIGRFTQNQVQVVLCRYIKEYVECRTCKSTETLLLKSSRLQFLLCESCNSRYTVCQIKGGFRAVTRRTTRQ